MIRQLLLERALKQPEAPAILAPDFEALNCRQLAQRVGAIATCLASAGVETGAPVALVCSNGPQAAIAFLGIAAHAACAPLNPAYRVAEFDFYLSDLTPAAIVVESPDSPARDSAAKLGIPIIELQRLMDSAACEGQPAFAGERDVALLLHTSGTTSRPKLVPLTHANLIASADNIARSLGLASDDRCLSVMPLFHVHGLVAALLASLISGGSVVCCPGMLAPNFFDWLNEFQPTWYTAVPTIHQSVLARAKSAGESARTTSLRFIRSCSSALAPKLMDELEAAFSVPVIEAYGMTEAAHQMTSNPLPPASRKAGSVGRAAGPDVAVMDDNGNLLPAGAPGEVVIRGPNVTAGYLSNADANAAAFNAGWFRTGDLGYFDDEGYLFLSGRRKEMINRAGEKISPREVDEVLLMHPAVAQAVSFAVPHSQLGESVAAAVVLQPERHLNERDLRDFASERLAPFKVPERILFLGDIPKGPTGKIQRIGLAERLNITGIRPSEPVNVEYAAPETAIEAMVADLFASITGVARVGMRDSFFDLGADSLLVAKLLARIRDLTGIEIPFLRFAEDPTVQGVCRALQSNLDEDGDARLRVVIRAGQSGPGLFCVPGSHGDITGFFQLARSLGNEQALTAFRLPKSRTAYRLEGLAERYTAEILEMQPEGPYHLAGVCTGGLFAYEVGCQLERQGREVGLLALLDCHNLAWGAGLSRIEQSRYRFALFKRRFVYQQRRVRAAGLSGAAEYLRLKIGAMAEVTRERREERRYRHKREADEVADARVAVRLAAARYIPPVYSGLVDLFRVEEPHVDAYDYPQMGWRDVVNGGITIHDIGGDHRTMLDEPHVRLLAGRLRERIAALSAVSRR